MSCVTYHLSLRPTATAKNTPPAKTRNQLDVTNGIQMDLIGFFLLLLSIFNPKKVAITYYNAKSHKNIKQINKYSLCKSFNTALNQGSEEGKTT